MSFSSSARRSLCVPEPPAVSRDTHTPHSVPGWRGGHSHPAPCDRAGRGTFAQRPERALTNPVGSNTHPYKTHLWLPKESKTRFMGAETPVLPHELSANFLFLNCYWFSRHCCFTLTGSVLLVVVPVSSWCLRACATVQALAKADF